MPERVLCRSIRTGVNLSSEYVPVIRFKIQYPGLYMDQSGQSVSIQLISDVTPTYTGLVDIFGGEIE